MKSGASAGAIAGGLALVAGMIAAIINAMVLQNPDNQFFNELAGLPTSSPTMVWAGQLGVNFCVGLFNVLLNAALGAGGIAIWSNTAGKNASSEPPVSM